MLSHVKVRIFADTTALNAAMEKLNAVMRAFNNTLYNQLARAPWYADYEEVE